MRSLVLILFLVVTVLINPIFAAKKINEPVEIFIKAGEHLAYGICKFSLNSKWNKESIFRLEITRNDSKLKKYLRPLYTVFKTGFDAKGEYIRCFFRLNTDLFSKTTNIPLTFSLKTKKYNYYNSKNNSIDRFEIIKSPEKVSKIENEWENEFRKFLIDEINSNEDHEMELLLYLKTFGELPPESKTYSWKKESALKFLYAISGLNDIRDAIPTEKNLTLKQEKFTKDPPKPILLPQVAIKNIDAEFNNSPLSKFIPRSCYYLEWDSMKNFTDTFNLIASQFDKWSKGTYPKSFDEIYKFHLERLGLFDKDMGKLKNNVKAIAIAGWDLNIQSGTNLLMIIQTKNKISLSKSSVLQKNLPGNIIILSTGKKLFKMALNCYEKGRSLSQVNNFIYSRNRLSGKNEKFFMYLSDYWLTNFISPRWKIFNDRLNTIDARIRMVFLLKSIYQAEKNSKKLASLQDLKKYSSLPEKWNKWIFNGLKEVEGKTIHVDFGGLFDHKPIDTLKFKKVTESEYSNYESFKQTYERRWRQMDPIALSIFYDKSEKKWGSVLYISPISNRSQFRFVQGLVCNPKIKHSFDTFDGQAFGLSVAIATKMFGFWLRGVSLPMNLFVQFTGLDFASSSYIPSHWLDDSRRQSMLSFMRMPGAFVLPELLISGITPMFRWINRVKSQYEGLEEVAIPADRTGLFPLYIMTPPDSGIAYIGLNPNTLTTIKKGFSKKKILDKKACDIRGFIDFKYGYMMRRKLLQLAVKSRGIASWRTKNRIYRISRLLGFENNLKKEKQFKKNVSNANVFPTKTILSSSIVSNMPDLINHKSSYSWGRPVMSEFKKLPDLLLNLLKLDFFISVENNAILIETDYKISERISSQSGNAASPSLRKACIANMKVYEGAMEMYHMDNDIPEFKNKIGKIGVVSDFPLLKENYIQENIECPSPNSGEYIVNMLKDGGFEIECPIHGTRKNAEQQLEPTTTPQPTQTELDFDQE